MIGGYPHRQEDSFLHLALEHVLKESNRKIVISSYTLDGFPITRVPKHLGSRCAAANPNIVVIQFATSDLVVPLRRKRNRHSGGISAAKRTVSNKPPNLTNRLVWKFQGLIGDWLRLSPVTPLKVYLETMQGIARTLLDHGIIPVVMSPFVFGGTRSDRFARACNLRLKQSLATLPQAVYVDAYSNLDRHPRHRMLLSDGTHLSLSGHKIVADVLFPLLQSIVNHLPAAPQADPPSAW
jgi:lysophospholipase L1-like esterase